MASTTTTIPPEEQEALKASIFQRLHPRVYLERFLSENIRPDGREFDEWRDVSVNVGAPKVFTSFWVPKVQPHVGIGSITTADGSALVRLGNTTIVCGVKAEIAEPELDRALEGFLGELPVKRALSFSCSDCSTPPPVPNLDLPAICSPKFKPGPPTEEAQVLSDRLNEVLLTSVSSFPSGYIGSL